MANPGRTNEARTIASLNKTSASAAVTAAAGTFSSEDVGRTVTGTGVPAGATIASVQSDTAATLSAAASATNTASAALGLATPTATGYIGWSPETQTEAATYSVTATNAGQVPPGRITSNNSPRPAQRNR